MKSKHLLTLTILAAAFWLFSVPNLPAQNPEVVYVPSSAFRMGDAYNEGSADEKPVHTVTPSTAFLIGQYEVTNEEYAAALTWALNHSSLLSPQERITGAGGLPYAAGTVYVNGHKAIEVGDAAGLCQIAYAGGAFTWKTNGGQSMRTHPAVTVTWYGAVAYCNWQSVRDGLQRAYTDAASMSFNRTSSNGYRLPSESEWEMAAAHDPTAMAIPERHWRYGYAGNQQMNFSTANCVISGNINNPLPVLTAPFTAPVGFFDGTHVGSHGQVADSHSHFGCYDMSGNVAEWVQDNYAAFGAGTPVDGSPYEFTTGTTRVVRGGSWADNALQARSATRLQRDPNSTTTDGTIGFRVARTDTAPPSVPLLINLSPSSITLNQVDAGQVITISGLHFSPASSANTVILNPSSANVAVTPFNANPSGTSMQFRVPRSFLPASFTSSIRIHVGVITNGISSVNDLILEVSPKGSVSLAIDLIRIPAGEFRVGDLWNEAGTNERPVHTVQYIYDYGIGQYEVTNNQYVNVLNWALLNASALPSSERITGPEGAPYAGGPVYINNLMAIDVGDENDWCQITYSNGMFAVKSRDNQSMGDHPVVMVTWFGSAAFCNWKSRIEGATPAYNLAALVPSSPVTGTVNANSVGMFSAKAYAALSQNASSANGYRLPTESEWERAAAYNPSSGNTYNRNRYGFASDSANPDRANYYNDLTQLYGNPSALSAFPFTSPVGFFNGIAAGLRGATMDSPNYYGCYDMSGNVYEWCQDWLHTSYVGAPADGSAWESPTAAFRVLRGGAWDLAPSRQRTAWRAGSSPFNRYMTIGFRVARTLPTRGPTAAQNWTLYR